jgi:hypothetical protein
VYQLPDEGKGEGTRITARLNVFKKMEKWGVSKENLRSKYEKMRETVCSGKYGKSSSEEIREIYTIQFTFAAGRGKRKMERTKIKTCYTVYHALLSYSLKGQ